MAERAGDKRTWAPLFALAASFALPPFSPSGSTRTVPSLSAAPLAASLPSATPSSQMAPEVDELVGRPAPDFAATAQDGSAVHLSALRGKAVVVYFYPKDETPGCTKEACTFRDAWDAIAKTGAVLIGVSADTLDSHKSFAAHHGLPFLLISDPDGSIGRSYGVPFQHYHARQTFVIGHGGIVRKAYRRVDVTQHAQEILGDLAQGY
jgi:peroxiredoxin Q/BCP